MQNEAYNILQNEAYNRDILQNEAYNIDLEETDRNKCHTLKNVLSKELKRKEIGANQCPIFISNLFSLIPCAFTFLHSLNSL